MLGLDGEREVHRQLQAFEHARQNRFRRGIIVVGLAAIDGVGRRPDHHALREKTLPDGSLNFGSSQGALAFGFAFTQALASATI